VEHVWRGVEERRRRALEERRRVACRETAYFARTPLPFRSLRLNIGERLHGLFDLI
jgi:hypothetical protein